MILRSIEVGDIEKIREIHYKHYPHDSFPDFSKLRDILVVEDEAGTIISLGGIELIAEAVTITNYDSPALLRGKALLAQLSHMQRACSKIDQNHLHVFENGNDEVWIKALKTYGFKPAGNAFFKKVSYGQRHTGRS